MTDELLIAIVSIAVNVILVFFVWRETRHIYRPLLTTKIISEGKLIESKPSLVERGPSYYLAISNFSANRASNIRIRYRFALEQKNEIKVTKRLDYLNPREAVEVLLESNRIFEENPELFQSVRHANTTKIIPLENMKLTLKIEVQAGSRIAGHKVRDSYQLEWRSMKSCRRFRDYPMIDSWNMRNGLYIHKLTDTDQDNAKGTISSHSSIMETPTGLGSQRKPNSFQKSNTLQDE